MLISVACHQFPPFFLVSMVLWNYKSLFPTVLFRSALSSWGRLHIGSRRGGKGRILKSLRKLWRWRLWDRGYGGGEQHTSGREGGFLPGHGLTLCSPTTSRSETRGTSVKISQNKEERKDVGWKRKRKWKRKRSDHPPQICLTSYCHEGGSGPSFYFLILSVSTWDKSLLCDDTMCPYNHIHLIGVIIQKNKNKTTGED